MRKLLVCLILLAAPASAQSIRWTCGLDAVAASLTKCPAVPNPGDLRLVITDIVAQSTTATAGQFLLQYGTGSNCGTGTASLLPSAASAVRIAAPANTAAATVIRFETGLVVPAGKDLCVLGVATNTVTIQITGYLTP